MLSFSTVINDIKDARKVMNTALINLTTELNEILDFLDENNIYLYNEDEGTFKIKRFSFNQALNRIEYEEQE